MHIRQGGIRVNLTPKMRQSLLNVAPRSQMMPNFALPLHKYAHSNSALKIFGVEYTDSTLGYSLRFEAFINKHYCFETKSQFKALSQGYDMFVVVEVPTCCVSVETQWKHWQAAYWYWMVLSKCASSKCCKFHFWEAILSNFWGKHIPRHPEYEGWDTPRCLVLQHWWFAKFNSVSWQLRQSCYSWEV